MTKLRTDCKWNCKSIEEEWLLSQELPGRIINEKTEDAQKKKRSILEKSGTQRRVSCDEDLMRLSLLSRPEKKGNPSLQG